MRYVARVRGVEGGLLLVKPLTFMNRSGGAVGDLLRFYKIPVEDLLVVLDEVALPAGQLRARSFGSAGGHNGLKSNHRRARHGAVRTAPDRGWTR